MNFQHLLAARDIGQTNGDLTVKAAGTQQGRVQYVWTVGRGDDDDAFIGFKTIHFDQKLVQGLLTLIIATTETGTTVTTDGVDFVDEDDAWRILLGLLKHVAHPARADADEHFNKVRT